MTAAHIIIAGPTIHAVDADALSNYWVSRQTEQQGSCWLPTGNDSVNTVQLFLGVCQIVQAAPLIARGVAVQVSS